MASKRSPRKSKEPFKYEGFERLVARVDRDLVDTWAAIEIDFLAIVAEIDTEFVAGRITAGNRKSTARYFNDLLCRIAQNRTCRPIGTREKREGAGFEEHDVDLCYPPHDKTTFVAGAEVKWAGMPQHEGNKESADEDGRQVVRDLDKRLREVGFNAVDLGMRWPGAFFGAFWAARASNDLDLAGIVRKFERVRAHYTDGIGALVYRAEDPDHQTQYVKVDLGPEHDIDEVLTRFCDRVVAA